MGNNTDYSSAVSYQSTYVVPTTVVTGNVDEVNKYDSRIIGIKSILHPTRPRFSLKANKYPL